MRNITDDDQAANTTAWPDHPLFFTARFGPRFEIIKAVWVKQKQSDCEPNLSEVSESVLSVRQSPLYCQIYNAM